MHHRECVVCFVVVVLEHILFFFNDQEISLENHKNISAAISSLTLTILPKYGDEIYTGERIITTQSCMLHLG